MAGLIDRVGILTDEVSDDFAGSLDWIREQGLRHVEVRVVNGRNVADITDEGAIKDIRHRVEDHGLFVSAIASPLFKCALDPSRRVASGDTFGQKEEGVEAHFEKLKRVLHTAQLLGTPRIRIFSFWREQEPAKYRDEIVGHLRRAGEIARQAGGNVQLLVENEPACNGGVADEVAPIVRAVNQPLVKGLWDPGNEAYAGREAFPAGYGQMKDVLAHVHLKDAYVRPDGTSRCVPVGSGNVAWISQFRALVKDGYQGLFTIETHYTPEASTRKIGSKMTWDAIRTLMSEV